MILFERLSLLSEVKGSFPSPSSVICMPNHLQVTTEQNVANGTCCLQTLKPTTIFSGKQCVPMRRAGIEG